MVNKREKRIKNTSHFCLLSNAVEVKPAKLIAAENVREREREREMGRDRCSLLIGREQFDDINRATYIIRVYTNSLRVSCGGAN